MNYLPEKPKHRRIDLLKVLFCLNCVLMLSLMPSFGINPGKIEGSVSDAETSKTLPFVRIDLLKSPDSTIVKTVQTNTEGKYSFDDVAYGAYLIKVSVMTYQNQIIPEFNVSPEKPIIRFGPTLLIPDSKMLNEVKVYGYKMTGELVDNKTVYSVKDKMAAIAQTGLDLLRQVPEVEVDYMSNEVRVAGSTNILYLVNDRRVDKNYLMQLNPLLIDKIEVITNPGSKYDADVDAVLNIILKRHMSYGLSGRLNLEIPTSKYFFSYNSFGIDYFLKNIRLFATANYGREDWILDIIRERTVTSDAQTVNFSQYGRGTDMERYSGVSYGLDWFMNDNNVINISSNIQPKTPSWNDLLSQMSYLSTDTSRTQTNTHATFNYTYLDYCAFYKHKFRKKDQEFTFEGNYNESLNYSDEDYFEQVYDKTNVDSLTDVFMNQRYQIRKNVRNQFMIKPDYTHPINDKLKLSMGAQVNFIWQKNSYREQVSAFFDKIEYQENRISTYTNLDWNLNKISIQAGLRYEMSDINIEHVGPVSKNYNCLLPFLSGQYKLNEKNTLRLNFRRSIQRPGMNQLSPINYINDSYAITIGNPRLNPAFVNRFEFTHRIQITGPMFVGYKPYFTFVTNGIQLINTGSDTIKKYYDNVSNEFEYGFNLNATIFPVKWFEISPSFTIYERNLQALPKYNIPDQSNRSWRISVSSKVTLPKDWSLFCNFNYNAPIINHQNTFERSYNLGAGFNKSVTKQFNVTVVVFNPLTDRFIFNKSVTKTESLQINSVSSVYYRYLINIRLKYNFSLGKEGKKLDRQNESETSRGGLL